MELNCSICTSIYLNSNCEAYSDFASKLCKVSSLVSMCVSIYAFLHFIHRKIYSTLQFVRYIDASNIFIFNQKWFPCVKFTSENSVYFM